MLVFYDLSGAVWINIIPELLKPYVSALRQVEIRLNTRPGCSQVWCFLLAWPFGWNPRLAASATCSPEEPWKKNPNPTPTEKGQNDRRTGGQDWIWTHPTSGNKVSEGRGWKGSGQWHESASLTVTSTALLWMGVTTPAMAKICVVMV